MRKAKQDFINIKKVGAKATPNFWVALTIKMIY